MNDEMAGMLARDTGRPKEQLLADMTTDHYLFGQEIIDYGLADGFFDASTLNFEGGGQNQTKTVTATVTVTTETGRQPFTVYGLLRTR